MRVKKVFLYSTSVIGTITIIILIISILIKLAVSSIFPEGILKVCGNEIKKEVKSPDGNMIAVAYIRDCGATTSFSPQVSIISNGEKFDDNNVGNVFIGDRSEYIDVEWENSKTLKIYYNVSESNIIKKVVKFDGIDVEYVFK